MVQLIIAGTAYPLTSNDKYKCYLRDLGESIRMASGRLVFEKRGSVRVIEYTYDYFGDTLLRKCLADLRSGRELEVSYREPESDTMQSGWFRCTKWPAPTVVFAEGEALCWHNVSFTLEAVDADA